jgi:hypothetical protein
LSESVLSDFDTSVSGGDDRMQKLE